MRTLTVLALVLAMFLSSTVPISAATGVVIYTDQTSWENALSGQFLTEEFSDDVLNPGVSFVSTESGHVNPAQEYYQDVLASTSHNEPMTTWNFVPEITAYGGNWTLGGPGGSGNSLLVSIADDATFVGSISNSYNGGFWGFVSDTPFSSVQLVGGGGNHQQNYRLDDMVYSPEEILGDFNDDYHVDQNDLTLLLNSWGQTTQPSGWTSNWDGLVNQNELTALLADWGYGTTAAAVPEPSSVVLVLIGALGIGMWCRKGSRK